MKRVYRHACTALVLLVAATGCTVKKQSKAKLKTMPEATAPAKSPIVNATMLATSPNAVRRGLSIGGVLEGSPTGLPQNNDDNLRQVSFTREGSDFDVAVDPTGQWLVYASTQHRPTSDLYLKSASGFTVTQLTHDPGNDIQPRFSPDGQWIAFASDRAGNWDIYLKHVNGGRPIQVTNSPAHELHPSWSPDSRQLAFCTLGERSGQWEMVVVDVANPATRRFIGYGLFPSFSPDGRKIAFQRPRSRGSRWFSVWTIDFENGEGTRPTEIVASGVAALVTPAWSPDGERLAFASVPDPNANMDGNPESAQLWVVNLDGSGIVKLTDNRYTNLQPSWSSNGTIYFISNRNATDNIWALQPRPAFEVTESAMPMTRGVSNGMAAPRAVGGVGPRIRTVEAIAVPNTASGPTSISVQPEVAPFASPVETSDPIGTDSPPLQP